MDSNSMYGLLDAIIAAGGVYVIYHYILMKSSGALRQNLLLPKDLDVKKCRDVAGYIQYTGTKQLIFGIIALAGGAVGLIQDFTGIIGAVPYLIFVVVFFVFAIWYGMSVKKAVKMFW